MKPVIAEIQKQYMKESVPEFSPGDTVRVNVKVTEKVRNDVRTRIQAFEGIVIAHRHSGVNEEVCVRRVSHGIGVERTFAVHSPVVDSIEVLRHGDVRRAKLYYLRHRVGRAARVRERARQPRTAEEVQAAKARKAAKTHPAAAAPVAAESSEPGDQQ